MVTTRAQSANIISNLDEISSTRTSPNESTSVATKTKTKSKKRSTTASHSKSRPTKRARSTITHSPPPSSPSSPLPLSLPPSPPSSTLPPSHPSALTIPRRSPTHYGLIQERLQSLHPTHLTAENLTYVLLIQAILWNQTTGRTALPVLQTLLSLYPTPEALRLAPLEVLRELLRPIGLFNVRAKRLVEFARVWEQAPPEEGRVYRPRGKGYGRGGVGGKRKVGRDEHEDVEGNGGDESEEGWEIAHLPGVGPYALDSWRIFGRDVLLGKHSEYGRHSTNSADGDGESDDPKKESDEPKKESAEPKKESSESKKEPKGAEAEEGKEEEKEEEEEWKRVVPEDKDLRAWMIWRWRKEGFAYDVLTGRKRPRFVFEEEIE